MSFSLKTLLLAAAYTGLFFAGLLAGPAIWAQLFVLATFLVVVFAAVVALFGQPDRRATRGAFALAAAAYLAITVFPGNFRGFPTTSLFDWLNNQLAAPRQRLWLNQGEGVNANPMFSMGAGMAPPTVAVPGQPPMVVSPYSASPYFPVAPQGRATWLWSAYESTPRLGHCLFAMLLGFAAAEVARRAARARPQQAAS